MVVVRYEQNVDSSADVTNMTSHLLHNEQEDLEVSAEMEEVEDGGIQDLEEEEEEEFTLPHQKSKSSSGSKKSGGGSGSKKDKSKKKKGGKKGGTGRKSGGSSSSHRQAVIEISVEDDDGEEIKMKFDDDEDEYLNEEEQLIHNLDLNSAATSADSDQEFPSAAVSSSASHNNARKKKKRGAKTKKGKRKTAAARVNYEEAPTPPESPPTPEPPLPKQSSNKRGAKSRQRHSSPANSKAKNSPTPKSSPSRNRSRGSNSPGSASKRRRSKTPPLAGKKKGCDAEKEEVDERILAEIAAAEPNAELVKENLSPCKSESKGSKKDILVNGLIDEVSTGLGDSKPNELTLMSNVMKISSPDAKRKPEKKFECYLCLDKFIMVAKFERHMIEVHKIEKPWKCEQCEQTFKRYFLMSQHVKIKHVDEDNDNDDENDEDEGQVSSQSDRLSENDVSGIDQSENDDEAEQQLIRANRASKPVVQYKPLAHFKHKSSLNILPTPVVSSMNMNNNNNFRASPSIKNNKISELSQKEVSESNRQLSVNVPACRDTSLDAKCPNEMSWRNTSNSDDKNNALSQSSSKEDRDSLLQLAQSNDQLHQKTYHNDDCLKDASNGKIGPKNEELLELRDNMDKEQVILEGSAISSTEADSCKGTSQSSGGCLESVCENGSGSSKEKKQRKSKLARFSELTRVLKIAYRLYHIFSCKSIGIVCEKSSCTVLRIDCKKSSF